MMIILPLIISARIALSFFSKFEKTTSSKKRERSRFSSNQIIFPGLAFNAMSRVVKFFSLGLLISVILANGTNVPRQNDFGITSQASNKGGGSSSAEPVAEQKGFQDLLPSGFAPSGWLHMVVKVCGETTDLLDTTSPLMVGILCNGD